MVGTALARLWTGRCSIWAERPIEQGENVGLAETHSIQIADREPCRVSFGRGGAASWNGGGAQASQTVVLFIRAGLEVPPGCRVLVEQDGACMQFEASGAAARYSSHQEIGLRADSWC